MASPTPTSAAASTMTNSAKTAPACALTAAADR
jgi:hypothetical protein